MNILITGISGLIGRALTQHFLKAGHTVFGLTRNPQKVQAQLGQQVTLYKGLPDTFDAPLDAVINLQGEGIADKPWSDKRKAQLHASRVDFTEQLVLWLHTHSLKPKAFLSASAVGFYGRHGDTVVDELTPPNNEYTHSLCKAWEQAAINNNPSQKISILRLGVVFSEQGGFLSKLKLPFKCGLGARLGNGKQYLSWVHLADVVSAFDYVLNQQLEGTFNLTAPEPVTNATFTQRYAKVLSRPAIFCIPGFVLKIGLGEMSDLLLTGQRVQPKNLLSAGFGFTYPNVDDALKNVTA